MENYSIETNDDRNERSLIKKDDQKKGAEELNEIFENVLPWIIESKSSKDLLEQNTLNNKEDIEAFLDSFHLFKVDEIAINDIEDDIVSVIYQKHQALITAAYQSNFTIATIIIGNGGGSVDLYFGVSGDGRTKKIFHNNLNGIFSGKGIKYIQEKQSSRIINTALKNAQHGGVLTGIPTQKIDDEKQVFDLTSIIRSMNGKKFVLLNAMRPLSKAKTAFQIQELMALKDRCHALANRTVEANMSKMENQSKTISESVGVSNAQTKGKNGGVSPTFGINASVNLSGTVMISAGGGVPPFGWGAITMGGTIGATLGGSATVGGSLGTSKSNTKTNSQSKSESETKGWSKSTGESLSYEQQNSLAMELELISDKIIQRLRAGLNSGVWENFITYATTDSIDSNILSGALCGELIKSDPKAFPIRNVSHNLSEERPLYIPKINYDQNLLKSNKLVSFISSEEASLIMSTPLNSVPGFDVRLKPLLSLTDMMGDKNEGIIGKISEHGREVEGSHFSISQKDIRKHVFVTGITGCGKTTTVKQILKKANDVPFLVLESAKREYRRLLSEEEFKDIEVYTLGDSDVSPIRHNPFMILPGVSLITHIDNLKSIFNASFSLYGPMPYILEKCLFNIYKLKGWNLTTGKHHKIEINSFDDCKKFDYIYPTIIDLTNEVSKYVETIGYEGELKSNIKSAIITRLESLTVGSKGFIFNTTEFLDLKNLLERQIVFELESLADDDDKAFFVGLMLALISEYRQSLVRESVLSEENQRDVLKHILIVEEAHRLLKNVSTERSSEMLGNPKGKAVEAFCNIIAEMRALGQGVIVAEQIPTKIAPDVIKNTNTKIVHRLVSNDDQVTMGASIGLDDKDSRYLNQLSTGFALVHKEGMSKPVEIKVNNDMNNMHIGDIRIRRIKKTFFNGELERELLLHESGLLWNEKLQNITIKLINSIFFTKKEIQEILPIVLNEVKNKCDTEYVSDDLIIIILKNWFKKTILSPLYFEKDINDKILEAIDRFWDEDDENFNFERLKSRFDNEKQDFSERVKEVSRLTLLHNLRNENNELNLNEIPDSIIDNLFLFKNEIVRNELRELCRNKIM
ncbi:hypothetical protein C0585_01845 [Candidatus Woesearchaeota archaeon]|mgnify:CR=1 FL=1|nr:MAG: hypothetical protein C0585_01845 [Candidatus Woesearchaeota archaeon]